MLEFIKKNKNIILSSTISSGINSNIYCGGCNKLSGKGNENNNKKKETTKTTETTETAKTPETPKNDTLKNKKDTLKNLLKDINEKNNKLKDESKEKITIDDNFIDSKTKEEELKEIETNLNTILTNINNKLKDKANLKEEPETPENPPKDKKPPVDDEFEKEKTELIEKVNNLEKDFKKFIFDEKTFIKTLKDKLNSLKKENIDNIKKLFETKDKELRDIINFDKFLTDNKYGEFLISSNINLGYDFSFYTLKDEKFYKEKTKEIIAKLSKLKITKDNISNFKVVHFVSDSIIYYFVVNFDISKKNILKDYFKDEEKYNDIFKNYTDYFIFDEKDNLKLFTIDDMEMINCIKFIDQKGYDCELVKKKHSFVETIFQKKLEELQPDDEAYSDFFIYEIEQKADPNKYYCVFFTTKTLNRSNIAEENNKFIKCINDNLFYIIFNETTKNFIEKELKIVSCSSYRTSYDKYVGSYKFTI